MSLRRKPPPNSGRFLLWQDPVQIKPAQAHRSTIPGYLPLELIQRKIYMNMRFRFSRILAFIIVKTEFDPEHN